jgi:hypothetical protein
MAATLGFHESEGDFNQRTPKRRLQDHHPTWIQASELAALRHLGIKMLRMETTHGLRWNIPLLLSTVLEWFGHRSRSFLIITH